MNLVINVAIIIVLIWLMFRNFEKALVFYTISTFVAPVIAIGDFRTAFDVVAFPILFIGYLLYKKLKINVAFFPFIPYLAAYSFSVLMGIVMYGASLSIANFYAILRCIILVNMILFVWSGKVNEYLEKTMVPVLLINATCCIVQMVNLLPVSFFYDLYYRTSVITLKAQLEIGYFSRAYGTTASPVILGGIAALSFAFFFGNYMLKKSNNKITLICIFLSIGCGLAALSKTAILTIPMVAIFIIAVVFLLKEHSVSARTFIKLPILILFGCMVLVVLVGWLREKGFFIDYYLSFLFNPFEALSTRYDSSSGILSSTMSVVKQNLLFGVGEAQFNNVFVGDSTYIVLLYQTGIFGLISFFAPFLTQLGRFVKSRRVLECAVMVAFLLVGIGNSLHFAYYIIPFYALIFDKMKMKNREIMNM